MSDKIQVWEEYLDFNDQYIKNKLQMTQQEFEKFAGNVKKTLDNLNIGRSGLVKESEELQNQLKKQGSEVDNLAGKTEKLVKEQNDLVRSQQDVARVNKQVQQTIIEQSKRLSDLQKKYEGLTEDQKLNSKEGKALNKEIQAQVKQLDRLNKGLGITNKTINNTNSAYKALERETRTAKNEAKELGARYGTTSKQFQNASKRARELDARLKGLDKAVGDNFRNVGNYTEGLKEGIKESGLFSSQLQELEKITKIVAAITGTNAKATKEYAKATTIANSANSKFIKGLKALKIALASTGIGAIVVALGTLFTFFTQTQEGADALSERVAQLRQIFEVFRDRVADFGKGLFTLFTDFNKGIELIKKSFRGIGDELENELQKIRELEKLQNKLNIDRANAISKEAQLILEIAEARRKAAENERKDVDSAIKFLDVAIKKTNELNRLREKIAIQQFQILLGLDSEQAARDRILSFQRDNNKLKIQEIGLSKSNVDDLTEAEELLASIISFRAEDEKKIKGLIKEQNALYARLKSNERDYQDELKRRQNIDKDLIDQFDDTIRRRIIAIKEETAERIKNEGNTQKKIAQIVKEGNDLITEEIETANESRELIREQQLEKELKLVQANISDILKEQAKLEKLTDPTSEQEKRLQQLKKFNKELIKEEKNLTDSLLDEREKRADEVLSIEEKNEKKRLENKDAIAENLILIDSALRDSAVATARLQQTLFDEEEGLLKGNAELSKAFVTFQKGIALAQIAVNTAQAISSLTAASAANPANPITAGLAGAAQFASGIIQITANIASATAILSGADNVPALAEGTLDAPKGRALIGEDGSEIWYNKKTGRAKVVNAPTLANLDSGDQILPLNNPEFHPHIQELLAEQMINDNGLLTSDNTGLTGVLINQSDAAVINKIAEQNKKIDESNKLMKQLIDAQPKEYYEQTRYLLKEFVKDRGNRFEIPSNRKRKRGQ